MPATVWMQATDKQQQEALYQAEAMRTTRGYLTFKKQQLK
jgi:hypothetical protein